MRIGIDSLATGGRGVGRAGGKVWLVAGALPGDVVDAEPRREHPRWVEATAVAVLEGSPDRRRSPCPYQDRCGGCAWMPLGEPAQREWKRRIVVDVLERIGGLRGIVVEPTIPSPADLGYRNRVELVFGRHDGRRVLGYHPPASGSVVDIERCLLHGDDAQAIHASVREFFLTGPGRDDPAADDPAEPLRLVLRRSSVTGEFLVALRGAPGPFLAARAFAVWLRERHPAVAGVVRLLSRPGRRGGARVEALDGAATLPETIAGIRFDVPASTFVQVNPGGAERLARVVLDEAGAPRRVLELYGGMGAFALALARDRGSEGIVVDADADALSAGRAAAAALGARVRFERAAVGTYLGAPAGRKAGWDLLLADPPRSGMERAAARAAARLGADRVVLVSCDPATLARDLAVFVRAGSGVGRVVPVDLFPQTPHVETVVRLDRGSRPPRGAAS